MRSVWLVFALATVSCAPDGEGDLSVAASAWTRGSIYRASVRTQRGYLRLEVLDDDLVHVEYAAGNDPRPDAPIFTSPMIAPSAYRGPKVLDVAGDRLITAELELNLDPVSGCLNFTSRAQQSWLSTICPDDVDQAWKTLSIKRGAAENAYGLGQHFWSLGSADGDWASRGVKRTDGDFGNSFAGFWGGANPQLQFPVVYVRGPEPQTYGLVVDNVYKQEWDFRGDWWKARMFGDQLRFFFMAGPSLLDVRKDFMELTGRPPVPPKKAFGLWISEFGFDNWDELNWKLGGLREHNFPVDGAFLDVQWFGGTWPNSPDSPMGRLNFDDRAFPDATGRVRRYLEDHIGLVTIEESYVAANRGEFHEMAQRGSLVHNCNTDEQETMFWNWMGQVGMIDWSDEGGARWWHDQRRFPNLVQRGIMGHWTDLGEPERYSPGACYTGVEPWKYHHSDLHNLYNLLWARSIWDGYARHQSESKARAWVLSRAGTVGMQRFGAGLWSGDIASRLDVLATHLNSQMHMSFAGIDYYGSDVGGFWRNALPGDTSRKDGRQPSEWELYTQWFANSAWFDVPLRPHTYNCGFGWSSECPKEISPAWVGDRPSNLKNLRRRYELIPYYYSLAYRAQLAGEPVFPPLAMIYQEDANVRSMGHEKLIGRDLLVGVVAAHGEGSRSMYLPHGRWFDYFSGKIFDSQGQWTPPLNVWPDGFRLPVFARAGAILPMMHVDEQTKDAFGHRKDGSVRDELIVKVFGDGTRSSFTLYEDDGTTAEGYDDQSRPQYRTRTTELSQVTTNENAEIKVAAANGDYAGAPNERNVEVRLLSGRPAQRVRVDGSELPRLGSVAELEGQERGWVSLGNETRVRLGKASVYAGRTMTADF